MFHRVLGKSWRPHWPSKPSKWWWINHRSGEIIHVFATLGISKHSWCLGGFKGFKPVRWTSNPHDFCSIRRTIIGCGMAESLCFGCSNFHFGWLNFAYFALFLGNAGRVWCGSFGMPQGSPRGPLPVPLVGCEGSYQARELASLLWSLAASKQWQWGWDMLCQSDPGDHHQL